MQPRDLFRRRRPGEAGATGDAPGNVGTSGDALPVDEPGDGDAFPAGATTAGDTATRSSSIRERQKVRRDSTRHQQELSAFFGTSVEPIDDELEAAGDDEDDDDEDPSGPVTGQVFIVFRSVSWADAGASLRESDSLVGVYATEAAARAAVTDLDRDSRGESEHWFQPYTVTE